MSTISTLNTANRTRKDPSERRKGPGINLLPNYFALGLLVIFALAPLLSIAFNAFKSSSELGRNPLGIPQEFILTNFSKAWEVGGFSTSVGNTLILVTGTVLGILIMGGMAAYSLAKLHLPASGLIMGYFLVGSALPIQLFLVPLFSLWRTLGWNNSLFGLIPIYWAVQSPFAIFLLRSYMVQIPSDFEDAARVDGANTIGVFFRIIVPLSWPAFLTVGLVVALNVWNEFLLALIFLTKSELFTVVTSYYNFSTRFSRDWSLTSAAAVMMTAPILIIFLLLQRRFVAGLTQGGLKG